MGRERKMREMEDVGAEREEEDRERETGRQGRRMELGKKRDRTDHTGDADTLA